ncbi:alpha/beta fold hydrolase [Portibacter lacus]|nr:alpha/beta hydrolase [Portibacter lacus]
MKSKLKFLFLLGMMVISSCSWEVDTAEKFYDLFYVERNGAQMPIHVHGNIQSKTFILILHGGPGGNGLQYRPGVFQESLEESYALVYIDQRGQGMSQGQLDEKNLTLDEMIEDINAIISVLDHKYGTDNSLFLLGHSWGGTLGTAFLTTKDNQDNFKGWIEVDGAHDFDLLVKSQFRLVQKVAAEEMAMDRDTDFWNEFIDKLSEVDTFNITNENISELNALAFEAEGKLFDAEIIRDGTADYLNLESLTKSYLFSVNPLTSWMTGTFTNNYLTSEQDLFMTNLESELKKIHIPSLLLWGKYDFVVPAELGVQAFENIDTEDKKLVIFEESGHSPMTNEAKLFNGEVISFIEQYK